MNWIMFSFENSILSMFTFSKSSDESWLSSKIHLFVSYVRCAVFLFKICRQEIISFFRWVKSCFRFLYSPKLYLFDFMTWVFNYKWYILLHFYSFLYLFSFLNDQMRSKEAMMLRLLRLEFLPCLFSEFKNKCWRVSVTMVFDSIISIGLVSTSTIQS